MLAASAIVCWDSSNHTVLVALGLVYFILIPLPFFSICSCATWRYPALLAQTGPTRMVFLRVFRFLFFRFCKHAHFYGVLALLRNLLICLVPVIVPGAEVAVQYSLLSGH